MVTITVYDGAGTIGGNKILLEDGDTCVFLDFGASFSTRFRYFEEFLPPRSRRGLLDPIRMGLLPPLRGLYRIDLEDPDGEVWDRADRLPGYRDCQIDAVLLSHAHLDHCGYLSFLDARIPLVSTTMTAVVCKAVQDCSGSRFEGELCYVVPKVPGPDGTLAAAPWRTTPYVRRPYRVVDRAGPDAQAFWDLSPGPAPTAHTTRSGDMDT